MAISYAAREQAYAAAPRRGPLTRLLEDERWLAVLLLAPTAVLLALFIAYPFLKGVLAHWMGVRARGRTLFCKADGKAITPREAMNYFDRALRLSKWNVLRGLHVLRHSYISALANRGIDQRVIDELAGHQTEQQRRRYRHLYQTTLTDAVKGVFG